MCDDPNIHVRAFCNHAIFIHKNALHSPDVYYPEIGETDLESTWLMRHFAEQHDYMHGRY